MDQNIEVSTLKPINPNNYRLIKEIINAGILDTFEKNFFIQNEEPNQYNDRLLDLTKAYLIRISRKDREKKDSNYLADKIELIFRVINSELKTKLIEKNFSKMKNNLTEEEEKKCNQNYKNVKEEFITQPYSKLNLTICKRMTLANIINKLIIATSQISENDANKYQIEIIYGSLTDGKEKYKILKRDKKMIDLGVLNSNLGMFSISTEGLTKKMEEQKKNNTTSLSVARVVLKPFRK